MGLAKVHCGATPPSVMVLFDSALCCRAVPFQNEFPGFGITPISPGSDFYISYIHFYFVGYLFIVFMVSRSLFLVLPCGAISK